MLDVEIFQLFDRETQTVATVERAFEHLQRCIVADDEFRGKWQRAFKRETKCEQLGAAHLLWHGIWAFKTDAKGERTDLVLGIPLDDAQAQRVATTGTQLVLTEWKLVRNPGDIDGAIEQATIQAKRYAKGILAGIELRSTRFLVVVSQDHLTMPHDIDVGGVRYRHINIAVDPSTPSRAKA